MSHNSDSAEKRKLTRMHDLEHGFEGSDLPAYRTDFISASDNVNKNQSKSQKQKLMLALLADAVLDTNFSFDNLPSIDIIAAIEEFIDFIRNENISIEDKFSYAQDRFGTASYDTYSKLDFSGQANFDMAVEFVLEREGILSNHSNDRGGLTKFGISQVANPDIDVANLTKEGAIAIYKERYWDAVGAGSMDMATALVAFDAAVNHGVGTSERMIEESGNDIDRMLQWRLNYYDQIVQNDDSQATFLAGWNNRIMHLRSALDELNDNGQGVLVASSGSKPNFGLNS